jgi:hypothetical protein
MLANVTNQQIAETLKIIRASFDTEIGHHENSRDFGQLTIVNETAAVLDDGEIVRENQYHVFKHDHSGQFLSSCTMTPTALMDAVLTGKADDWNVVFYDQETGEAATICPRCAVGLSCRGSES